MMGALGWGVRCWGWVINIMIFFVLVGNYYSKGFVCNV